VWEQEGAALIAKLKNKGLVPLGKNQN